MRWTPDSLRRAAIHYSLSCFATESTLRATEFAWFLGISAVSLSRMFRDLLGITPSAFFIAMQSRYAALLLARKGLTTAQVAYRAGFGSRRNLFRVFRREYDETPSRVAEKVRKGSNVNAVVGPFPADAHAIWSSNSQMAGELIQASSSL